MSNPVTESIPSIPLLTAREVCRIIVISAYNDMIKTLEKTFKSLGDRNRLRIVHMLGHGAMCVCEITDILKLSQSTVSGHLRVLKEAALVEDSKDGLWVEYRLAAPPGIRRRVLDLIASVLADDPDMQQETIRARKADRRMLCKR